MKRHNVKRQKCLYAKSNENLTHESKLDLGKKRNNFVVSHDFSVTESKSLGVSRCIKKTFQQNNSKPRGLAYSGAIHLDDHCTSICDRLIYICLFFYLSVLSYLHLFTELFVSISIYSIDFNFDISMCWNDALFKQPLSTPITIDRNIFIFFFFFTNKIVI